MTLDDLVELLVGGGTLTGATLSRPRATGTDEPPRITVQPVTLKRGKRWAVRRHYGSRTTDENLDDAALGRLLRASIGKDYRQALLHAPDADWQARGLTVTGLDTSFEVWRGDRCLGPVRLRMPGRHHALNALAALAVADDMEIPFRIAAHALEEFGGIHRRFEVKGEEGEVLVVDDYGHHPEEIRATSPTQSPERSSEIEALAA